jgi:hypothetical protein
MEADGGIGRDGFSASHAELLPGVREMLILPGGHFDSGRWKCCGKDITRLVGK